MMKTTITFGPHVQLLIVRADNRQIESVATMVDDNAKGYALKIEDGIATLMDTTSDPIEMHRENIVYINEIPTRSEPYDSWLQSVIRRIALWCQNTALDRMLSQWTNGEDADISRTCLDLIEYVDHCERIDVVRWIHWGLAKDGPILAPRNESELFERFLDCIDQVGGAKAQVSHILNHSLNWMGQEPLMSCIDKWIENHPNTTRFHRWLRRWRHQHSNRALPEWIAHAGPNTSGGCIASGPNGDVLWVGERQLSIRSASGIWTQVNVPSGLKPTAALGLWDGSWLLISAEQIHRLIANEERYTFETEPILTVSRQHPAIGSFQGRPYIIGGEENDHTMCELWDRRDKLWLGFHMQSDHHLQNIHIKECTDGIEVLGLAGSSIEHWKLTFVGEQSGESKLIQSLTHMGNIASFIFVENDIIGVKIQSNDASLVRWNDNQWEELTQLPNESVQDYKLFSYDNNQLVLSSVTSERTNIAIHNALSGNIVVPKFSLPSFSHPQLTILADGTLLCANEQYCYSIFV